ncbi:MAG: hypothetical protein MJ051_07780 [Akkermansia sp.]|nr:hypothetical protein [Akkermansia sp.]
MKLRSLSFLFFLLSAMVMPAAHAQEADDTPTPAAETADGEGAEDGEQAEDAAADDEKSVVLSDKNYIDKNVNLGWANCKGLESSLGAKLEQGVKSLEPAKVRAFVSKGKNRLLLAQYMMALADINTPEEHYSKGKGEAVKKAEEARNKLAELEAEKPGPKKEEREAHQKAVADAKAALEVLEGEANIPNTMQEFAASKDAQKVLKAVTGNEQWMEDLVLSGVCIAPGRAMALLAAIGREHPEMYKDDMVRRIATATAIEWSKSNYDFNKGLLRADYYIRHYQDKQLNVLFDDLPMNLRRMVCGCKGDNRAGEVPSLEWALMNVKLPEDQYPGSCWRNGYKLYNVYGSSIHGADYGLTFDGMYDGNHHQFTFEVGGVCGGLSHFGAFAALANGIPAMTMGEPGHCAFLVLIRGKWTPAYSLGWEHGSHFTPWPNFHQFASIHMMTELYSPEQREATYISDTYRALGHHFDAKKQDKKAIAAFRSAVSAQPLSFSAWLAYAAYLKEHHAADEKLWLQLHDDLCTGLVPRYPEMAAALLQGTVYPALQACVKKSETLADCVHLFWDNVTDFGPDRWHVDTFGEAQLKLMSPEKPDMTDAKAPTVTDFNQVKYLFAIILSDVGNNNKYSPAVVEWANEKAAEVTGGNLQQVVTAVSSAAMAQSSAGRANIGESGDALVRAAEKAKDVGAFQQLAKTLAEAKNRTNGNLPDYAAPADEFMSTGSLVYTGKYDDKDDASRHWGVLEKCGGCIKTAALKDAWIGMKLKRDAFITSVVLITPDDSAAYDNMQLQVSESGEAGSWADVGANLGKNKDRVHVIDLGEQGIKTKYMRVIRKGGSESFQLNAFHAFGRKAA